MVMVILIGVSVCCVLVTDKGADIGGLQRGTR